MPLFLPQMYGEKTSSTVTDSFFGLNRKLRIGDGEFYDMQNLSSDDAPVMSVRKRRGKPLYEGAKDPRHIAIRAAGGLGNYQTVFIDGTTLWLGYVEKVDLSPLGYVASGDKQLIAMGAYIIVMPDMIYVNTADVTDAGRIEDRFEDKECKWTATVVDYNGEPATYTQALKPEGNVANGETWHVTGDRPKLMRYNAEKGDWYEIGSYLRVIATKCVPEIMSQMDLVIALKKKLTAGDAVRISGLGEPFEKAKQVYEVENAPGNDKAVSAIIVEGIIGQSAIDVQATAANPVVIERNIPKLDYACESGNRLWGCYYGPGADGKLINEIYCCARGDFFRWGLGLADNEDAPVTFSIGTDGAWTGAVNYDRYPTFFKERMMHRVGGYGASGFALYDTPCMGVARGAHKSLAVVGNILYYKSAGAVMGFDGSTPVPVSDALGRLTGYTSAVGGACGEKYYLAIHKMSGSAPIDKHVYVLDTAKGLWHREDGAEIESMAAGGNNLWMIAVDRRMTPDGEVVEHRILTAEPTPGAIDAEIESDPIMWYAETGIIGLETTDAKYLTKLVLKLRLEAGASVRVSVQYDSSGIWKQIMATETPRLKTVPMSIIPMRCDHMRLRLDGIGDCKVFSITKVFERAEDM